MKKPLPIDIREKIISLAGKNRNQTQIADELDISRRSVQYNLKKFQKFNSLEDRPRAGRPRKVSAKEEKDLVKIQKKNPENSARQTFDQWKTDVPVSLSTAKRILYKYGIKTNIKKGKKLTTSKIKKKKVELTIKMFKKRK